MHFIFYICIFKALFGEGVPRLPQTAKGQSPVQCYPSLAYTAVCEVYAMMVSLCNVNFMPRQIVVTDS